MTGERNEPLFVTDELVTEWLNESMRQTLCIRRSGGWCCEYHDGFLDALGVVQSWQAARSAERA